MWKIEGARFQKARDLLLHSATGKGLLRLLEEAPQPGYERSPEVTQLVMAEPPHRLAVWLNPSRALSGWSTIPNGVNIKIWLVFM